MGQAEKVTIYCAGGCGRSETLRPRKISQADYYLCETRADGERCRASLPPLSPGKMRCVEWNAAGSFAGYTDVPADDEHLAAVERAKAILAAGEAQLAIDRAMRGSK